EFVKLALEFLVPAASRETTGISVACDLGAYPGGLPRDRNTPRIETRRISDLETLGTTSRKYHSNKHIQLISKISGANPETGLSYPERPPPGS
ncbi:MAG: hypothetical protein OXH69_17265, partial [Acidobacteria bacterium]|nr:hypothetical protein [Acidobacteriota bacterium]